MAPPSSIELASGQKRCVCGNSVLTAFSPGYLRCEVCETLVAGRPFDSSISRVSDDEKDFYGRDYWYLHQNEMGFPNIETRCWEDLGDRCVHWLNVLLKYKSPPARALELGCAHGGFVALLNWVGFEATGLELSPSIAEFARRTFSIPVLAGPLEEQNLPAASYDVISLMDVLEHLPDPAATIRHCLELLASDGILIVQTPQYREGRQFERMAAEKDSFLQHLKPEEHLYLFSASSLERFFRRLGLASVRRETAIFDHYDQFLVVGRSASLEPRPAAFRASASASQRLVQALLDQRSRIEQFRGQWQEAEKDRSERLDVIHRLGDDLGIVTAERNELRARLTQIEAALRRSEEDRDARLEVIEKLSCDLAASERDREARLAVFDELSAKWQASEADRAARLAVIDELFAKWQASEADRAARLAVIDELFVKWQASEADRAARLAVIDELFAKWQASEADRAARLAVIDELFAKWQASEADRAARLAVIEDISSRLEASEAESRARLNLVADAREANARLQSDLAEAEQNREGALLLARQTGERLEALEKGIGEFVHSRTGRVLRVLKLPLPSQPLQTANGRPAARLQACALDASRMLEVYSLPAFQSEFVNSRPDLEDVRQYNRKMLEMFADLRPFKERKLLDVGASPHGFALERALDLGILEYCGIGLGIAADIAVRNGSSEGVLLKMNAEAMSLPAESFDLIVTLSTFEHFFHPDRALSEMHRVLKRGGAVLVDFQPVWTSIRGHHLHHIPEVSNLLPPWAHLRWSKRELLETFRGTWPAGCSMNLDQVAHWIYDSDEINRLDVTVLRDALQHSPFKVEWLTPHLDDLSESDLASASELNVPYSLEELKIRGFSALLVKT